MSKKQLAQAGVLAAMITVLFECLMFYHAWLLINGICTLGIFACIFFLVVLVWTKGAILPNPYPYCHVVLKKRGKKEHSGSFDMCFCNSDCTNKSCDRCKKSKHFEALQEYMNRHPYYRYAVSDFSYKCEEYKHE